MTKPTRRSIETFKLGRRRYAIIDMHNPTAKAMKRNVFKVILELNECALNRLILLHVQYNV